DIYPPTYSPIHIYGCSHVTINNLIINRTGRSDRSLGDKGNGYAILIHLSSRIFMNNINTYKGWKGLDGNFFRDVTIDNSLIREFHGHASVYDVSLLNSRVIGGIAISGGGYLNIDNCFFNGRDSGTAIRTRNDYGC